MTMSLLLLFVHEERVDKMMHRLILKVDDKVRSQFSLVFNNTYEILCNNTVQMNVKGMKRDFSFP